MRLAVNNKQKQLVKKYIIVVILSATVSTMFGIPSGAKIPFPTDFTGYARGCDNVDVRYQAHYTSVFGGTWNVHGLFHKFDTSQYAMTINGTISDQTLNGTFRGNANSEIKWLMEVLYLCDVGAEIPATYYELDISNGSVHGFASYR